MKNNKMENIVLVGCGSKKAFDESMAIEMYVGAHTKKKFVAAETIFNPSEIWILSGEYGLRHLGQFIKRYNLDLRTAKKAYKEKWAKMTLRQMRRKFDFETCNFIFLTGKAYYENLIPHLVSYELPWEGFNRGEITKWFSQKNITVKDFDSLTLIWELSENVR